MDSPAGRFEAIRRFRRPKVQLRRLHPAGRRRRDQGPPAEKPKRRRPAEDDAEPRQVPGVREGQPAAVEGQIAFKGQILGPTAPPANFVALDFANYIIELKHQAGTLGWATNPGVQDSLDVKLDLVKKKLEAGDAKAASNMFMAGVPDGGILSFLNSLQAM